MPFSNLSLLGRWSSSAVLGYVEEALAERTTGLSGTPAWQDLDATLGDLESRLRAATATLDSLEVGPGPPQVTSELAAPPPRPI